MQRWNNSRRRRNRLFIFFVLGAVFFCGSVLAEMRIWEDTSGTQVKADFVRELFGSVELRRPDGSRHSIPLENLSAGDLKYLRTRIPPEIELEVRTQSRAKERNKNTTRAAYEQFIDNISVVTATVNVRQKSSAPFGGTLRAEVYLIGKEVATDDYRLCGKGASQIQLTEENRRTFTFETSTDFRVYEEYNYDMRGAEYAGYLVVVIDPSGSKLAVRSNLPWLEGDEKIEAVRKLYVDAFFDEDCRKRSVPRPRYYEGRREF